MKKTLILVTAVTCFGFFTANAQGPYDASAPAGAAAPPLTYYEAAPNFIYPGELGFGVAVGVPYDLYYISDSQYLAYYLYKDRVWYIGTSYLGPWTVINYRSLPPQLRKYKVAKIRTFRDRDYLRFHEKKGDYKGKHFRPEPPPVHREEHRDMREERREDRRDDRGGLH